MATNIQHNVAEVSTTPTNGQPWNFSGILDSYLIPRVVARDSALPPGARLLWGVIRQHSGQSGRCVLSDKDLGAAVGVEWQQCLRYCHQLERAGLLRTTARPGKTPIRELLWDARFAGKIKTTPVINDRGGCQKRQGGLSDMTAPYKEEGSLKVVYRSKSATIEKAQGSEAPSSPVRQLPPERTEEEIIRRGRALGFPDHVIQRDLDRLRERLASPAAKPMVKASELTPETDSSAPRSRPS